VIHLPGHTAGHCGFYSAEHDLLFAGDLFADYVRPHLPPAFLNTRSDALPAALRQAVALRPRGVVLNHYFRFDPPGEARHLQMLSDKMSSAQPGE
jgi:glyoxylase-like metal-dependent hydrolase (beta-lactamase superfamily II)